MVALSAIRDLEQPSPSPSAAATSALHSSGPPRRTRSTRKFLPPALLLLSILGLALAWGFGGDGPPRQRHGRGLRSGRRLGGADNVSPCDANHSTCALATQNCGLGSDGSALQLFDYFQFHYCTLGSVEPLSYALLFLWLMVVFSLLASTADNYSSEWSTFEAYTVQSSTSPQSTPCYSSLLGSSVSAPSWQDRWPRAY